MLVMIDNYDSFTFNLVQYFGELGADPHVYRNDEITVDAIEAMNPDYLVVSPGPGRPHAAGISKAVIKELGYKIPLLGVCLGYQAIGEVYGATVRHAPTLMHGKTSEVFHDKKSIFQSIENPFIATRYHSLVLDSDTLPECVEKTAWTDEGVLMGIRHKIYPVEGVQFHPESILTTHGKALLKQFLAYYARR